jgi:hypothetical protein
MIHVSHVTYMSQMGEVGEVSLVCGVTGHCQRSGGQVKPALQWLNDKIDQWVIHLGPLDLLQSSFFDANPVPVFSGDRDVVRGRGGHNWRGRDFLLKGSV